MESHDAEFSEAGRTPGQKSHAEMRKHPSYQNPSSDEERILGLVEEVTELNRKAQKYYGEIGAINREISELKRELEDDVLSQRNQRCQQDSRDIDRLANQVESINREMDAMKKKFHEMHESVQNLMRTATTPQSPVYVGERLTPVRKFVDFSKEELQKIQSALEEELTEVYDKLDETTVHLVARIKEILSAWEDEAHQNGEVF